MTYSASVSAIIGPGTLEATSSTRMSPNTMKGCRPISVTYQPATVAIQPEKLMPARPHSSGRGSRSATLAGWYVTEIGRQPWLVQGVLRTADAASDVPTGMIALTLALYLTVYAALIVAYVGVIRHMAGKPVDLHGGSANDDSQVGIGPVPEPLAAPAGPAGAAR